MISIIKNLIQGTIKPFIGKKKYQNIFEYLYNISLKGMNIGINTHKGKSGEVSTLVEIKKTLLNTEPLIVFDVGANVGEYTKLVADTFRNNARIYSFEPSGVTFLGLKENTKDLKHVKTFNAGLGEKEEYVTLYKDKESSRLASYYKRDLEHRDIKFDLSEEVHFTTLDEICASENIERINLLKIDVEGHELKVLLGATELLAADNIDYIQFEFGGSHKDSRTYFKDFMDLLSPQFKLYRVLLDGLESVKKYNIRYETFSTTNYLAKSIKI